MDCRDVKQALLDDAQTDEVRAHLDTCEPCAELAKAPELTAALSADESATSVPDTAEMFARLTAQVDAEQSFIGWLKSSPTWMRQSFASLTVIGATLYGLLFLRRPDLDAYPQARMAVSLGLLGVLLLFSLAYSLRPMHRSPLPGVVISGAVVTVLALSFGLAVAPNHYHPHPSLLPTDAAWLVALRCLYVGTLVGLPVYVVGRLLDRSRDPRHAMLGGGAAGLTGQLVLLLHCPVGDPLHLVFGHACVAIVFLGLVAAIVRLERRFHARASRSKI